MNDTIKLNKFERIAMISNKINSINNQYNNSKKRISDSEARYKTLEENFNNFEESEEKKYQLLNEELKKIKKNYDHEISLRDNNFNLKIKELDIIDNKIYKAVENIQLNRRESDLKIEKYINEKFLNLKNDMKHEKTNMNNDIKEFTNTLNQKLSRIEDNSKNEQCLREENDYLIINKINEDHAKMNDIIGFEKGNVDNSINSLDWLFKEVLGKIKNDLIKEKKDREINEDHLLTLLDKTCNKISDLNN